MSTPPSLWMTPLQRAEFASTALLHAFWKKATALEAEKAIYALNAFLGSGLLRIVDLPAQSYDRSIELARPHGPTLGIRTLDSLHVACALELGAEKLWTFDERQARVAKTVGLDSRA